MSHSGQDPFEHDVRVFRSVFPEGKPTSANGKTILILDRGSAGYIRYEIYLYRVLQTRGFNLVSVGWRKPDVVRYYDLLEIPFYYWDEFMPHVEATDVERLIGHPRTFDEIRSVELEHVRLGVHALAECFRTAYTADNRSEIADWSAIVGSVSPFFIRGIQSVAAAATILERFRPDTVLFGDGLYTLQGIFIDTAISRGIDAITTAPASEDSALYLKRYNANSPRDWPYCSISELTWQRMLAVEWDKNCSKSYQDRHRDAYGTGQWYSLQVLNKHTRSFSPAEIREELRLDPTKKTAVIFPHVIWDTPIYGNNLFPDYGSWLIAVVRAAAENREVDWVIKSHPGNMFCAKNEDFKTPSDCIEQSLIRNSMGELPGHVRFLMPDTAINTHSLLQVANYCLTVRGTVGIEAASMGVTVLTGGDSYYSGHSFTVDSGSPEELIAQVRRIDKIPGISDDKQRLAECFAYAAFYLRPFRLRSLAVRFLGTSNSDLEVEPIASDGERFVSAEDMTAFVEWLTGSSCEDYISEEFFNTAGDPSDPIVV